MLIISQLSLLCPICLVLPDLLVQADPFELNPSKVDAANRFSGSDTS